MVVGSKSRRAAFDRRLVIAEPHLPWALPSSSTPRKSGKSSCPRCHSVASPGSASLCTCQGTSQGRTQTPSSSHNLLGHLPAAGLCQADDTVQATADVIHVSFENPPADSNNQGTSNPGRHITDLRSMWLGCRQGSVAGSQKVVSFSEPAPPLPARCASVDLPDLRSVWLGSRLGSIAGPSLEEEPGKSVSFQEPEEEMTSISAPLEDLEDLGSSVEEAPHEDDELVASESEENEAKDGDSSDEDVEGIMASPGKAPGRRRSFNVQELRSMWLGSRHGSTAGPGAEEMSVRSVTRSMTLGRRRRVTFIEDSPWAPGAGEEEDEHCEGEKAKAAMRVQELRSIWLGSRQGSLGKSEDGESPFDDFEDVEELLAGE